MQYIHFALPTQARRADHGISVGESAKIEALASRQKVMQSELEGMKRQLDNVASEVRGAVGKLISVIGTPDCGAAGKKRSGRRLVIPRSPEKVTPQSNETARSDGEGM